MALHILTDSACDIDLSQQEKLHFTILPLKVFFGDTCYIEGENLTKEQFYTMLAASSELPKTAQINPLDFEEVIRPWVEAGDEILILPLSKELSGTYQSAILAKESFPDAAIYVVDTLNVTFGQALLVQAALDMREQGMKAKEIFEAITALVPRVRLYAVIDDLKYLRLGGRLSSASAVVGTLLGIKPLIALQDGKVVSIAKARGQKAGYQMIVEKVREDGIDGDYPVYFGHSNAPEMMKELAELMNSSVSLPDVYESDIGPVVGTHAGPGCTGIAFIAKAK